MNYEAVAHIQWGWWILAYFGIGLIVAFLSAILLDNEDEESARITVGLTVIFWPVAVISTALGAIYYFVTGNIMNLARSSVNWWRSRQRVRPPPSPRATSSWPSSGDTPGRSD
jgi:Na+/proline symporter